LKPCTWVLVCLTLTLVGSAAIAQKPDWESPGNQWWSHIQFLAGDNLEGRATGSPGFEKAAAYMVEQFRAAGLEPAGVDGYRQPMDFHVVQIDEAHCALDLLREGKAQPLQLGDEAVFAINSRAAESAEAGAVFVGYGLCECGFDLSGGCVDHLRSFDGLGAIVGQLRDDAFERTRQKQNGDAAQCGGSVGA
jgi:hypothetical protein